MDLRASSGKKKEMDPVDLRTLNSEFSGLYMCQWGGLLYAIKSKTRKIMFSRLISM
jgi:hypothetical protein